MSEELRLSLVRSLHQSQSKLCLSLAGGGSLVLSDLLTVPGGSQTLLEASVPYCGASLTRYIGQVPDHYCSERTARYMAMSALYRALQFTALKYGGAELLETAKQNMTQRVVDVSHENNDELFLAGNVDWINQGDLEDYQHLIGIGCTASLVTNREKKGAYRIHVALQTLRRTVVFSLYLKGNVRSRWEEERLTADLILNAIETLRRDAGKTTKPHNTASDFYAFDTETNDDFPLEEFLPLNLKEEEKVHGRQVLGSPPLVDVFFGKTRAVLWQNGKIKHFAPHEELPSPQKTVYNPLAEFYQAVFPGSFNPIHQGHKEMLNIAEEQLGSKVSLEISVRNVDKPPLDYEDLKRRLSEIQKFHPSQPVWLTQTPLFENKAELFRGTTFVVGADTLRRFADLRFYHESTHQLHDVLRTIAYYNCRFLVFARNNRGTAESLETLDIPDMLRSLCEGIPDSRFTMNISSSEIRRNEE